MYRRKRGDKNVFLARKRVLRPSGSLALVVSR